MESTSASHLLVRVVLSMLSLRLSPPAKTLHTFFAVTTDATPLDLREMLEVVKALLYLGHVPPAAWLGRVVDVVEATVLRQNQSNASGSGSGSGLEFGSGPGPRSHSGSGSGSATEAVQSFELGPDPVAGTAADPASGSGSNMKAGSGSGSGSGYSPGLESGSSRYMYGIHSCVDDSSGSGGPAGTGSASQDASGRHPGSGSGSRKEVRVQRLGLTGQLQQLDQDQLRGFVAGFRFFLTGLRAPWLQDKTALIEEFVLH